VVVTCKSVIIDRVSRRKKTNQLFLFYLINVVCLICFFVGDRLGKIEEERLSEHVRLSSSLGAVEEKGKIKNKNSSVFFCWLSFFLSF
jgi:hypothetical protein